MAQQLEFFQSLWAMERRQPGVPERSMEENFRMISQAGYHGACIDPGVDEIEQAINAQPLVTSVAAGPPMPYDLPLREAREQFEKNYLEHQLREAGGSVGKLAKRVGMERTHLYRKLRSLGIDHKKGAE